MPKDSTYYFMDGDYRKTQVYQWIIEEMDSGLINFIRVNLVEGKNNTAFKAFASEWESIESSGSTLGYILFHNRNRYGDQVIVDAFSNIFKVDKAVGQEVVTQQKYTKSVSIEETVKEIKVYGYDKQRILREGVKNVYTYTKTTTKDNKIKRYTFTRIRDVKTGRFLSSKGQ